MWRYYTYDTRPGQLLTYCVDETTKQLSFFLPSDYKIIVQIIYGVVSSKKLCVHTILTKMERMRYVKNLASKLFQGHFTQWDQNYIKSNGMIHQRGVFCNRLIQYEIKFYWSKMVYLSNSLKVHTF